MPLSTADLADWEGNYGTVSSLKTTSSAVPEPSTFIPAAFATFVLFSRRHTVVTNSDTLLKKSVY